MNTPTILFLNGRYLTTLVELQEMLRTTDTRLHLEILAAYKDGTLTSWLAEGGNDCAQAYRRLASRNFSDCGNNEILQQIALAINNSSTTASPTIKYDIAKLVEFIDATHSDNYGTRTVANGEIIQAKNVQEKIQIEFKFKIKSPENDSLPLQLRIVNRHNNAHKFDETQSLSLNRQQNSIETVKYTINTTNFARSIYEITLNNNDTEICHFTLFYSSDTVLHFGPHRIKMIYVNGNNLMPSLMPHYISDTPLLDVRNRPITGLTDNNIRNLLSEWKKAYGITLFLPNELPGTAQAIKSKIIQFIGGTTSPSTQASDGFKVACTESSIKNLHTTHPEYFEI